MYLHTYSIVFAAVSLSAFAGEPAAPNSAAPPQKAAPPAPLKVHKIGKVVVSGSFRTRQEGWGWFAPDSGDPNYTYSGNIFRLNLSQAKENWSWQTEFALPFLLGLPQNAQGPGAQGALGLGSNYFTANGRNQNTAMFFPKQAFLSFKNKNLVTRVGRFEFNDGSELTPKNATMAAIKLSRINMRLLGHFAWTHVGRSYDGLHLSHTTAKGNVTFVGAVPTRGVFQTDGWGWSETAFGYGSYTKPFVRGNYANETRVFGLYYDDWRFVTKTDSRPLAQRNSDRSNSLKIGTFGGHSLHAFDTKAATYDFFLWGATQTGKWGSQDHQAYAIDLEGGFQPKAKPLMKLKPWLRGGFATTSGDNDPNDSQHRTFFQIMPTPRPFARFPFFNMMNNQDIYGGLILRPHPKVSISSEFHSLALHSAKDLWYLGGGVFQPWSFGYVGRNTNGAKSLANLYDTSVDIKLNAAVSLNLYYGHAQGLSAIRAIYPKGQSGHFGFVELMYKF